MAGQYRTARPHTAVVELDALRPTNDDTDKLEARRRGLQLTAQHLRAGADVVVPQFLGRRSYVDELATVAQQHGADFLHIVLTADRAQVVDRFRSRRSELRTNSEHHPEDEIADEDIDIAITEAMELIDGLCAALPGV